MTTLRVLLVTLLLVATAVPASAGHRYPLHWVKRDAAPVVFLVDATAGRFPVREAADRWNRSKAIHFKLSPSCPANRGCTTVRPKNSRFLGFTTLYHDRVHIQRAVVELSSSRPMSSVKRLSVTCHELGHALGLDHRQTTSSCMYNSNAFPPFPDRHDLDELRAQYAHAH